MLRMEKKCLRDNKISLVFKRLFDEVPQDVAVMDEDDTVEIVTLIIGEFSDFRLMELLRELPLADRARLKRLI